MSLTKIDLSTLSFNPFDKINTQWALLSAGSETDFNMMTVSWGGLGVLWAKPVTTVYVRHTRLTHDYMDKNGFYVLTFLKDGHRNALNRLGSKSGRDIDKMQDSGLTPCFVEGQPTFEEAELALVCRKLYKGELTEDQMLDPQIMPDCYPDKNMHSFYIGEIVAAYAGA